MQDAHRFSLTENGKTTLLLTKGKYCDRNIAVTPYIDENAIRQEGIEAGEAVGKQMAYDAFWDSFQMNGDRRNYQYAFTMWDDAIYDPKYPIIMGGVCRYAFQDAKIRKHININTSACTSLEAIFVGAKYIQSIGTIDATGCAGYLAGFFNGCSSLITLEKLKLLEDGSQTFSASFFNVCGELRNIVIEGTIGNTLSIQYSPYLSRDSITSVINALSSTASGKTLTLKNTAKKNAFTDNEWATLIATKPNWTISLV